MLISNPTATCKMKINSIQVQDATIKSTDKVKNLGVMFDKSMTMESHVNYIYKKAFLNIKNISMIRKSLNREDTRTAVTPHLDYGNALLSCINGKYSRKLKVAQNSAARLIERLRKHDRITHIRKEHHWLPISSMNESQKQWQ